MTEKRQCLEQSAYLLARNDEKLAQALGFARMGVERLAP
jgi:hypothetical protein